MAPNSSTAIAVMERHAWHTHPQARQLILNAAPDCLPGLSMDAKRRLWKAKKYASDNRMWFPPSVDSMVAVDISRGNLLSCPGLGRRTIAEITSCLHEVGLNFGMTWDQIREWKGDPP